MKRSAGARSTTTTFLLAAVAGICCPAIGYAQVAVADSGQTASYQTVYRSTGPTTPASITPAAPRWYALSNQRLANLRGGYELPSGLLVSFGIERAAYVNGVLVTSASLTIPDVASMTSQQAAELAGLTGPLVVQVGPGNTFDPGSSMTGVVIQNTLDNQVISTFTTLSIGVGTLGLFQDLNSYTALQNALTGAPGSP